LYERKESPCKGTTTRRNVGYPSSYLRNHRYKSVVEGAERKEKRNEKPVRTQGPNAKEGIASRRGSPLLSRVGREWQNDLYIK